MKLKSTLAGFALLILAIALSACGSAAPATPTIDPNAVYTEVAATIAANMTQTAQAMPTNTPTLTPEPTQTPEPTLAPTATLDASLPTVTTAPTQAPTAASASSTGGTSAGDHAAFNGQTMADGTTFSPGQVFSFGWTLKNDGTTTWTTDYYLKYISGANVGGSPVYLDKEIKPNGTFEFFWRGTAPTTAGDYVTHWGLYNKAGQMITEVYFHFFVAQ